MLCTPSSGQRSASKISARSQVRIARQVRIGEMRRARCIVRRDHIGLDVGQREQQRRDQSGSILARDTVKQQRLGRSVRDDLQHFFQLRTRVLQHCALPHFLRALAGERRPLHFVVREQRDLVIAHAALTARQRMRPRGDFARPAQIDDSAHTIVGERLQPFVGELHQIVGAQQRMLARRSRRRASDGRRARARSTGREFAASSRAPGCAAAGNRRTGAGAQDRADNGATACARLPCRSATAASQPSALHANAAPASGSR